MIVQVNQKYNIKLWHGLVVKNKIARPSKCMENIELIATENSNWRKYITVMDIKNTTFSLLVN